MNGNKEKKTKVISVTLALVILFVLSWPIFSYMIVSVLMAQYNYERNRVGAREQRAIERIEKYLEKKYEGDFTVIRRDGVGSQV